MKIMENIHSLSEYLESKENQGVMLDRIVSLLRKRGEWKRHGLFAKIAKETGLSPNYVGRILNGKQALTENFAVLVAGYLKVSPEYLIETPSLPTEQAECVTNDLSKGIAIDDIDDIDNIFKDISDIVYSIGNNEVNSPGVSFRLSLKAVFVLALAYSGCDWKERRKLLSCFNDLLDVIDGGGIKEDVEKRKQSILSTLEEIKNDLHNK